MPLVQQVPQQGRLEWIGLRPARRGLVTPVDHADAVADHGLVGDHAARRAAAGRPSARQVTLIQVEHLDVVAALVGHPVTPAQTRRNLVVSGINLRSLKDRHFAVGEVVLLGSGECHPCSRMEENLGVGGFQAMRGHGGLLARVVTSGTLRRGDTVHVVEPPAGGGSDSDQPHAEGGPGPDGQ